MHYSGSIKMELVRKAVHILTGVTIVLLFQAKLLTLETFGLLILLFTALILFNYRYEREVLTRILNINRADRNVPGIDILFYVVACFIVLWLFDERIAFASILILAFGDSVAHLISRSFGATHTMLTKTTYLEGTIAAIVAATLVAWLYVPFWAAILAATAAMIVEAGELRIGDHHVDDNLIIPLVAGFVLWLVQFAFPF